MGGGSSPTRTRRSGRPPPIGLSISRASARLSGSTHRSSGQAFAPLVQREATGTASIEDGASLPLPPDERDTAHDLRGVVTCRDDPRRIGVASGRDSGTGARPENRPGPRLEDDDRRARCPSFRITSAGTKGQAAWAHME